MVNSIDFRTKIEGCISDKKTVWYAKIDERIFVSRKGRRTFNRRCDLVNAIKKSRIRQAIEQVVANHIEFFKEEDTYKHREEVLKHYWDAFLGEGSRCQIYKIELP